MPITESRKRKFRRWANKGIPKGAAASEKRAFGAFLTNRRKRIAKRLGSETVGKAKRYETKRTRGKWSEIAFDRPLRDLESDSFRRLVVDHAWNFHRTHRGSLGFLRLKILAAENPYSPFPFNVDGDMAEHFFGAHAFKTKEECKNSVDEICDRLAMEVLPFDNGEARIVGIHVFTVRNKRGVKPSGNSPR